MVFVTAISGLLLVHSASPDPGAEPPLRVKGSGALADAMPMHDLLIAALKAVVDQHLRITTPEGGLRAARGPAAIERALFRPGTGTVQVLLRDAMPLEVILDWKTAQVLSVAPRHEMRWARVHSGEALGEEGTALSDGVAGLAALLSVSGIWIWFRDRRRADLSGAQRLHRRLGLVSAILILLPAATGAFLNHRVDLGYTFKSFREFESEDIVKNTPATLAAIVDAALVPLGRRTPGVSAADVEWIEYYPNHGYTAVRFRDQTDVFVTAYSHEVMEIKPARDAWVRQLHSGRLFGAAGWIVTDAIALLWLVVTCGGVYLMITPGLREQSRS